MEKAESMLMVSFARGNVAVVMKQAGATENTLVAGPTFMEAITQLTDGQREWIVAFADVIKASTLDYKVYSLRVHGK
jgi:hypothetical protein